MSIVVSGFLIGISLIVAIGPQNAYIIKQGIKREHIGVVVAVCAVSDAILVISGTAGVGVLIDRAPMFLTVLKWAGVAYLAWFGYTCFRDAITNSSADSVIVEKEEPLGSLGSGSPSPEQQSQVATLSRTRTKLRVSPPKQTWVKVALTAMAFTWLNPGAYIDALIMLGGIANQHGEQKWLFTAGVMCANLSWFPFLAYSSARFSHVLARPSVWRMVNFAIGCIMVLMCVRLIMH